MGIPKAAEPDPAYTFLWGVLGRRILLVCGRIRRHNGGGRTPVRLRTRRLRFGLSGFPWTLQPRFDELRKGRRSASCRLFGLCVLYLNHGMQRFVIPAGAALALCGIPGSPITPLLRVGRINLNEKYGYFGLAV